MDIRTSEAWTILGLLSIAELERGLCEAEKLLERRILNEFSDVAIKYYEDEFYDFAWSKAVEKDPAVKRIRNQGGERGEAWVEKLDDAKLRALGRVMGSVMDGWRF